MVYLLLFVPSPLFMYFDIVFVYDVRPRKVLNQLLPMSEVVDHVDGGTLGCRIYETSYSIFIHRFPPT